METPTVRLLHERRVEVLNDLDKYRPRVARLEEELAQIDRALVAAEGPILITGNESSEKAKVYHARLANPTIASLTIKEMVVKALGEHFISGATSQQLLQFFERQWGRKEMRTSLSPQLSRLKESGIINLQGKLWRLGREEVPLGEVFDFDEKEAAE
jgi:hypothetical protein